MKKTKREWLNALPEPIRSKALANTEERLLNVEKPNLWRAIAGAFDWEETPKDEGFEYWSKVAHGINPETGELLTLEEPTTRLAELEAKRDELDKRIQKLKKNIQMVYCSVYTYSMSQNKLGFCTYESDKKRQEVIDRWKKENSFMPVTFELPFHKVDGKWKPAFEIKPLNS